MITNRFFVLTLLLMAYILSFIDRNIMSILVQPIRAEFGINDFQYGLLNGLAFSLFYVFLGVPVGWLADRKNRKNIIAIGTGFWSVMTFFCGLTTGFASLFLARVGVGLGEAALSPPAHSILSDYFEKKSLPLIMAVFTLGIPVGVGVSYSLGGWVYGFFASHNGLILPLIGELKPWQATFMIVGLPGLFIAGMIYLIVEPPRKNLLEVDVKKWAAKREENEGKKNNVEFAELRHFLLKNWRVYLALLGSVACLAIMGYGFMMWFVAHLSRVFHIESHVIAKDFGVMYLVFGSAGTLFGGFLSGFLAKQNRPDAGVITILIVAALWLIPAIVTPQFNTLALSMQGAVPCIFLLNAYFGVAIAALQLCTPNQLRAQVSAMLLLMGNLAGLAFGPAIIGFFSDKVFSGEHSLGDALSLVAAIFCPLAMALVYSGLKPYRELLVKAEAGWR